MRSVAELEAYMEGVKPDMSAPDLIASYLQVGEEMLENWITAHDGVPTEKKKEGFRILALQRQGAKGDPSFNACRETTRELVYHYNLVNQPPAGTDVQAALKMAELVANHLVLFIGGKLQVAGLGEFCCSSKSLRLNDEKQILGANHA